MELLRHRHESCLQRPAERTLAARVLEADSALVQRAADRAGAEEVDAAIRAVADTVGVRVGGPGAHPVSREREITGLETVLPREVGIAGGNDGAVGLHGNSVRAGPEVEEARRHAAVAA